jgi:hypothetical protein
MITDTTSLDKIKKALDFDQMSKTEQEELLLDMGEQIYKGTILASMEAMDEKSRAGFVDLIEKNASQEKLAAYIEEHVSNADAIAEAAVTELVNDILAVIGE